MSVYVFPVDAVAGAPSYTGRQLRQLLGVLVGAGSSARPLAGGSGVNPRTASSTVAATSSTWTVNPHGGYVDAEAALAAGGYLYTIDAAVTGSMTAADASNPRIDLISVRISDPAESDGTSTPSAAPLYTVGTAAATPAVPSTPARSMVLAQINVPKSGGGSPSVTWVAPVMVAAGGSRAVGERFTVTTDASGYATVTHGLGFTPSAVVCTPYSPITAGANASILLAVLADTFTSTTFRARAINDSTALMTSTLITFSAVIYP